MRATLGLAALVLLLLAGCGGGPPAKYYYYPAWGFSVAMPSPPTVTETPASPSVTPNIKVSDNAGSDDFAVYAADLPPSAPKDIDQLVDLAAPAVAKSLGGEVGGRTYAATVQTTNQAMGREITIDKDGQPILTLRIYLVGNRIYQLAASTDSGPAAKAFLDSFTILAGAPASTAAPGATNAD